MVMPASRGAARGPYRAGIRRREQIIEAAIEVFGQFGFAGGSVRSIADRVGVSHASLLQHFGSKEGLLMDVLAEWDRRTIEARLADATGLEYFQRLPEVMGAHLEHPGLLELFTTIAAEASSPEHPAGDFIRRRYATNVTTLATHLRNAMDAGDITALSATEIETEARLVTAVLDGIGLQWLLDPTTAVVASVRTYIDRSIASWRDSLPASQNVASPGALPHAGGDGMTRGPKAS